MFLLVGGPISWHSKLQSSVLQSSTETEYVASAEAAKEAIWLRQLLHDLNQVISLPTTIFINNHGVQLLAKNPLSTATPSTLMFTTTLCMSVCPMALFGSAPLPLLTILPTSAQSPSER